MEDKKRCESCGKEITCGWKIDFDHVCPEEECITEWFMFNASMFDDDEDMDDEMV